MLLLARARRPRYRSSVGQAEQGHAHREPSPRAPPHVDRRLEPLDGAGQIAADLEHAGQVELDRSQDPGLARPLGGHGRLLVGRARVVHSVVALQRDPEVAQGQRLGPRRIEPLAPGPRPRPAPRAPRHDGRGTTGHCRNRRAPRHRARSVGGESVRVSRAPARSRPPRTASARGRGASDRHPRCRGPRPPRTRRWPGARGGAGVAQPEIDPSAFDRHGQRLRGHLGDGCLGVAKAAAIQKVAGALERIGGHVFLAGGDARREDALDVLGGSHRFARDQAHQPQKVPGAALGHLVARA